MCVWPAEFPSIQPGLGNLPLPLSIPIPLPATVTFCAWSCPVPRHIPTHSKENKNEQLITRTDISNMWLSTCFFQVLGDFFPSWGRQELLRELPASHPSSIPLWLPDQGRTCSIFPTSSRNILVYPAVLPFPPQPLHSTRLDLWTRPEHHIPAGCSRAATLCLGSHPQGFGKSQPTAAANSSFWVLVPQGFSLTQKPRGPLDAIVGHCQADVVVVTCHLVVGGAADGEDALHSQLVHGELVGINDPSVPAWKTASTHRVSSAGKQTEAEITIEII